MDLATLYQPIQPLLDNVDQLLAQLEVSFRQQLTKNEFPVSFPLNHGKKLRAALFLFSAGESARTADLVNGATVLELLHYASLVHDDILDQDDHRRGQPSLHHQLPLKGSLLAGDYLFAQALRLVPPRHYQLFTQQCLDLVSTMCLGELKQLHLTGEKPLSKEDYLDIIYQKTAVFFGRCCFLGALFNPELQSNVDSLQTFGEHFGMAFQLLDDQHDGQIREDFDALFTHYLENALAVINNLPGESAKGNLYNIVDFLREDAHTQP